MYVITSVGAFKLCFFVFLRPVQGAALIALPLRLADTFVLMCPLTACNDGTVRKHRSEVRGHIISADDFP